MLASAEVATLSTISIRPFKKNNFLSFIQVLKSVIADSRVVIDDISNDFLLLALRMIFNLSLSKTPVLPLLAHFVIGSFSAFVILLAIWRFPKIATMRRIRPLQNVIVLYYG